MDWENIRDSLAGLKDDYEKKDDCQVDDLIEIYGKIFVLRDSFYEKISETSALNLSNLSEEKILEKATVNVRDERTEVTEALDEVPEKLAEVTEEVNNSKEEIAEQLKSEEKANNEAISHFVRELVFLENQIQNNFVSLAEKNSEKIQDYILEKAEEYNQKIRQWISDAKRNSFQIALQLQGYARDLSFWKRLTIYITEKKDQSNLLYVLKEVHNLIIRLPEMKDIFELPWLSKKLASLRCKALEKELMVFEEKTDKIVEEDASPQILTKMLGWNDRIQPRLSRSDPRHEELKTLCMKNRTRIREEIAKQIKDIPLEKAYVALEKLAWDIHDRVNEILSQLEDIPLSSAVKSLETIYEQTKWSIELLEQYEKDAPEDFCSVYKKLCKIKKRVRAELQEKRLQERLEGIFGRKFVTFFENFILFLIFAVIGLLIFETNLSSDASNDNTRWVLMLIDTGICVVFLTEFFTKFFLAEGNFFYFRRHWFIDFLPSIPFGLVANARFLDYSRSARLIRLLRLSRIIRYVRILRPVIRIFRVLSFLFRGTDRLVNRYARWLNRNIIFFSTEQEMGERPEPTLSQKLQEKYEYCIVQARINIKKVSFEQLHCFMIYYLENLECNLEVSHKGDLDEKDMQLTPDLAVEDALHTLLTLNGPKVEEIMGVEFPDRIYKYLGFLNAPLIRKLPGFRTLVAHHKDSSPPQFAAWLGRCVGRIFERCLALIHWFADLCGNVTGTKIIDKVGNTMVVSFQRPAKKLVFIGASFWIMNLLLQVLPIPILKNIVHILDRYIGTPMIIIGGACMLPLFLGMWLRNIAGEATEFYQRISEAQYINLLEDIKAQFSKRDLEFIYKRVVDPELSLVDNEDNFQAEIKDMVMKWSEDGISALKPTEQNSEMAFLLQQIRLLYRDYLDGAPLHWTDVKTTEQLLGNITLGNIISHRLNYKGKNLKELEKLDLNSGSIFRGPYLWFSLITESIANNTAQITVDYNQHALPKAMIPLQFEEAVEQYRTWLNKKSSSHHIELSEEVKQTGKKHKKYKFLCPKYLTSHFTALHFLTVNPAQDEIIRLNFEENLYKTFLEERKELIRKVFGSYPLHNLPKPIRTVNLYSFYQDYMAGGKIFTFPIRTLGWGLAGSWMLTKWLYKKFKEVLNPALENTPLALHVDFKTAVRKINRMRKPVYMQCMKIRAQFDFEYLGLTLTSLPGISFDSNNFWNIRRKRKSHNSPFERDLAFIHALDSEWDYFYNLRKERKEQLHQLSEILKRRDWWGEETDNYLKNIDPSLLKKKKEVLRALGIAYTINYRHLASLLNARKIFEDIFEVAIEKKGRIPSYKWYRVPFLFLYRFITNFGFIKKDWKKEIFDNFWQVCYAKKYTKKQKRWCWRAFLVKQREVNDILYLMQKHGDAEVIEEIIRSIICYPTPWSEELITIRTIQALSIMDVQNYRQHVAELGDYPEKVHYES